MKPVVMTVSVMGDEYGIGGHGNGDLLVVVGDSGGIAEGCNTYRGGVGGGHVNKDDDKGGNGAHWPANSDGNGIAVEGRGGGGGRALVAFEKPKDLGKIAQNRKPARP